MPIISGKETVLVLPVYMFNLLATTYSPIEFFGKAPTAGPSTQFVNSSPSFPPRYLQSDQFSRLKFYEGTCQDPLNTSKPWSPPETLPENQDPTSDTMDHDISMLRDVLQNQIPENSKIAGREEVVVSKAQYEEQVNDLLTLTREAKRLMAENRSLEAGNRETEEDNAILKAKVTREENDMLELVVKVKNKIGDLNCF
ncbi:hypothetical protein HOY82DRAFT_544329 [Tuber indicum]|nr:hypothetical protein HOY82DRAFT_544329 [Tuber indicum]